MDIGSIPLFPFGFGLSYTDFVYENLKLSSNKIKMNEILEVSADVTNTGKIAAAEIVQLYTRDIAADISRPIKELRGFQRISLKPGEKQAVVFKLKADDLAFYNSRMEFVTEPGLFHVWIAKNSQEGLMAEFEIIE
jgi:beta-glucosidase